MTLNPDAQRWNARYLSQAASPAEPPRQLLQDVAHRLPASGLALDVAMGRGSNAALLLERGLRVIGFDISWVAARYAKAHWPALDVAVLDLTQAVLPSDTFDVILNFYYLDRALWPQYWRALKPGGWLVIETMTRDMLRLKPDLNPSYLLEPGELRTAFADWDVFLEYEGWCASQDGQRSAVSQLAACRPHTAAFTSLAGGGR